MTPTDPPPTALGAALRCRRVAVTVDRRVLLRDLDLHVAGGQLCTIVGPSGAGKTTLLRAIAGLTPITTGTVHVGGQDLATTPTHRRRLGMVFQEPRLLPTMSVGDNVAFPLRMAGTSRTARRRAAADLLDEVGLPGTADRSVRTLSGGEAQRVALARALAGTPRLLLLDEPLSAVDPERRESLRELLLRVQRDRSITTLYVTHDRAEAAEIGDVVALLIEGRIVQQAPPRELFARPSSAVAARFVGASNLLSGTVRGGWLQAGPVRLHVAAGDGPATVAFRPEQVRLAADGPLQATVIDERFQGDRRRLTLDIGGTRLTAHVPADRGATVGQSVAIAIDEPWLLPEAPVGAVQS